MRSFSFLFLNLLSIAAPVLSSSRLWQPPANHAPETAHLDKRWLLMDKKSNLPFPWDDRRPWKNREISYCFSDRRAKRKLKKHLKKAHELWKTAGLSDDFTIVEASRAACRDDERRSEILMISYAQNLATYVGVPTENSATVKLDGGPSANLTDRKDIGMFQVVPNIAHELGHAWGLFHEHQNPYFWSSVRMSYAKGGGVFGPGNNDNWRCENLKDYDKFADGITTNIGHGSGPQHYDREALCGNYLLSAYAGFSARDYLPMPSFLMRTPTVYPSPPDMVDWNSMMLYPSGAGGRDGGDAQENDGDTRLSILERPGEDGSPSTRIKKNIIPSTQDIDGMNELYGDVKVEAKGLLQSRAKKAFQKAYNRSRGGASSCQ